MSARFSIIIPTHNRRVALTRLLRSLAVADYPTESLDVIVVADGCADDTVAALATQTYPFRLRVLEQHPARGPGAARNLGAAQANGDILLFIDDDIAPFPTLLQTHARLHAQFEESALIGAPVPVRNQRAAFHRIAAWAWWEQQFERMSQDDYRFVYSDFFTGVFSVSAALYRRVGGFDDFFAECHEDSELGLRLLRSGARVLFARDAGGMHHEIRSLKQLLERKQAEGKADVRLAQRYPDLSLALKISRWGPPWSAMGIVQRVIGSNLGIGNLALAFTRAMLALLERLHARRIWTHVHGALVYFAYWRGAALEAGGLKRLRALVCAHSTSTDTAFPVVTEIDLSHGLEAAELQIDSERPDILQVRLKGLPVAEHDAVPGAERLRGVHLRRILMDNMSQELLWVLAPSLPVHR